MIRFRVFIRVIAIVAVPVVVGVMVGASGARGYVNIWVVVAGAIVSAPSGYLIGFSRHGPTWFHLALAAARARCRAGAAPAVPGVGMRVAAWLMPRAAGQEWLDEAHSVMFEAAQDVRRSVERSYLFAAGQVLMVAWAAALTGRLRAARGARLSGGRGR